jgi:hypothetical protein
MLDEVLKLNADAAAHGEYEVAYHLLMASLHVAEGQKNVSALDRITERAKEQGAAIERVQLPHQLSRKQAQLRGQTALFDSLLAHIEAVRLRLQSDEQRARARR